METWLLLTALSNGIRLIADPLGPYDLPFSHNSVMTLQGHPVSFIVNFYARLSHRLDVSSSVCLSVRHTRRDQYQNV